MHSTVGLLAPRYVVGEHEVSVETIDNRLDVLRQHDMPDVKELWGWDTYRRTDLDLVELTATCVNQTLADAGLRPGQIDHVIALGWDGDGFDQTEQSPFIEALSERLDFRGKVTLIKRVGCAWMAFAIHHAKMLLDQGSHHVLVVTAGKLADDAQRFQCYGVIMRRGGQIVVDTAGKRRRRFSGKVRIDLCRLRRTQCVDRIRSGKSCGTVWKQYIPAGSGA
jgi:3-oxoacyl-[acyl-carrier-protein] synthase-3